MDTSWVRAEFTGAHLHDQRQRRSLIEMVERLDAHQGLSYSASCGPALRKAGWRLFSQETVHLQAGHQAQSLQRAAQRERVLLVQDTTDLNYHSHAQTQGLGVLGGPQIRGLRLHTGLMLNGQGLPLGILGQRVWGPCADDRPGPLYRYSVQEKDSGRWIEVLDWANTHLATHPQVLIVADREADFYEYLAQPRLGHIELLVRVQHLPRRVHWQGQTRALAEVGFFKRGQRVVALPAASGREARQAELWVDVQAVEFPPTPQRQGSNLPLWIVRAWEGDNPDPAAIDWYLLTTQRVESLEGAYQVLDEYCLRWRIERFHYVLKQGLRVERLQFDTLTRLSNALQIYSVIAWHLLYLTHLVREQPQAEAQGYVPAEQVALLERATRRKLTTLQEVVLSIAGLAGFKASKKQPWPGEKSLWQGLSIFHQLWQGWQLATSQNYGTG